MITSYLQGGLGNQMFQIAAAYSLSKKINTNCEFDFNKCYTPNQGNVSTKYQDGLFKKIKNNDLNFNLFKKYHQPNFKYNELPLIDNQILIGDFQSEKYFKEFKDEIISQFYFDDLIHTKVKTFIRETVGDNDVTAIHVRRGDYTSKPNFHPTCDYTYYHKGMELINTDKYIVISDDIEWCKKTFIGEKYIFSPFTNEIDDLYLIMNCDNHIIANSSFSWWGAYLSKNINNKVIAPITWFGPLGPQDTNDIYLNKWIKL